MMTMTMIRMRRYRTPLLVIAVATMVLAREVLGVRAAFVKHSTLSLVFPSTRSISLAALSSSRNSTAKTTSGTDFGYRGEPEVPFRVPLPSLSMPLQRRRYSFDDATDSAPRSNTGDKPSGTRSKADGTPKQFRIYCDLDGVLVDFAHGISQLFDGDDASSSSSSVQRITSHNIDAIPRGLLWDRVQSADAFFENLPWCEGGRELWTVLAPLRPDILTGVPAYCQTAPRAEKFAWCQRELLLGGRIVCQQQQQGGYRHHPSGVAGAAAAPEKLQHVDKAGRFRMHYPVNEHDNEQKVSSSPTTGSSSSSSSLTVQQQQQQLNHNNDAWHCTVITCWSERKHHESGPGVVLIDDRIDLRPAWEAKGGIFIHHVTGDVANTLQQLRQHGILPSHDDGDDDKEADNDRDRLWQGTVLRP